MTDAIPTARTALILGGASDIGRAVARSLAISGHDVILAARQSSRLAADAEDLRIRGQRQVTLVDYEATDLDGVAAYVDALPVLPDVVVSVVGLLGDQARSAADPATAQQVMTTNYIGPALLLGEFANRMEARGSGIIVGISSVAGDRGRASNYVYGSAKAGLTAFLSGLRARLSRTPVRVITVKPGFVATRMTAGMKLNPLLTAQPDEVAAAIARAIAGRTDVVYVRPVWRLIMAIIRAVPEPIFKKTRF